MGMVPNWYGPWKYSMKYQHNVFQTHLEVTVPIDERNFLSTQG